MGTISSISEVIKNKKGFQKKPEKNLLSTHTIIKPKADMSDPVEREKAMQKAERIKAENEKPIIETTDDEKEELNEEDEKEDDKE